MVPPPSRPSSAGRTAWATALMLEPVSFVAATCCSAGLVPGFLPRPPQDWYSGNVLSYQRLGTNRYKLWSVGANGRDEGGDPTPARPSRNDWMKGVDCVWPSVAAEVELESFIQGQHRVMRAVRGMKP